MRAQQIDILLAGILFNGSPLASGKVYTYEVGTTTNKTTYTNWTQTSAAANPIILDAQGKAQVYVDGPVKLRIDDSTDTTRYTLDNLFYGQQDAAIQWGGTSSGAANIYNIALSPVIQSYYAGLSASFLAHQSNTASPTISINGLTSKNILKLDGRALSANDIRDDAIVTVVYESVSDAFIMTSALSTAPDTTSWSPTISASGAMTIAAQSNTHFRYKKLDRLVWVSASASFTTGGVAATDVKIPVPTGLTPVGTDQLSTMVVISGTGTQAGIGYSDSSGFLIARRYDSSNWALGAGSGVTISGFYYTTTS